MSTSPEIVLRTRCTHCGKKLAVPPHAQGRKVKCPACGQSLLLPNAEQEHTAAEAKRQPAAIAPGVPEVITMAKAAAPVIADVPAGKEAVEEFARRFDAICSEVEKVIVGLRPTIEDVAVAFLAEGNALLEGIPGLGKTYLIKTLGQVLNLQFRRVQFTADLMPSDIIGTNLLVQDEHGKRLQFQHGPIFTNLLLADEINRATPKTQASLLEAMEEHCVTVSGVTNRLEEPFFVLATQNPIEQDGTYPLPKAQLDKFLFKLLVGYPSEQALCEIALRTTFEKYPEVGQVTDGAEIMRMRRLVRQVPIASHVEEQAMRIVRATQPDGAHATPSSKKYLESGAGPRALLGMLLAAKVRALSHGNFHVGSEDIRSVALQVLRHRVQRNLEAEAEELSADAIVARIIEEAGSHGSR